MGQQSLIYSFVARGTVILAEFTEFSGNFTSIAAQCLQKLPATNNKFTYNCDGHTFNYLVEDGYSTVVYLIGSNEYQQMKMFSWCIWCVKGYLRSGCMITVATLCNIALDFC
ncbi:Vesicle-associated membrane protein 721 [Vitis vinifera]|uniref:Vesicle-associated membrane protein 721 n=1 Tax=Vitis vinifera TaxID=29760 RepID=A0A438GG19_VITVI|nr:Vesicle-associated membrane protein 721 [Vitis vinifera]